VPKEPEIRVDGGSECLLLGAVRFVIGHYRVVSGERGVKVALRPPARIHPAWFDHCPQPGNALADMAEAGLARVQFQLECVGKMVPQDLDQTGQEVPVMVDEDHVVDVTAVEPDPEIMFDEVVNSVEVEVGEHLTGQIPDRQPAAGRTVKQRLVDGKPVPIAPTALDHTVVPDIVEHHRAAQLGEGLPVRAVSARLVGDADGTLRTSASRSASGSVSPGQIIVHDAHGDRVSAQRPVRVPAARAEESPAGDHFGQQIATRNSQSAGVVLQFVLNRLAQPLGSGHTANAGCPVHRFFDFARNSELNQG